MKIGSFELGKGRCFIVAEMSCNHGQERARAHALVDAAANAGADAIKFQTYSPATMGYTRGQQGLEIEEGPWKGMTPYQLYRDACMPWEWHEKLFSHARKRGLIPFSTPYDRTAVDFLEQFDPACYKISSFELTDLELIKYVASKGRPMILSTGMADEQELKTALDAAGCESEYRESQVAVLHCVSKYPTEPKEADFNKMYLQTGWIVPYTNTWGFSDHTLSIGVPVAAVVKGAWLIEKHLTISRDIPTFDQTFSLGPQEFKIMVQAIRDAEIANRDDRSWRKATGEILDDPEAASRQFRRVSGEGRGSYIDSTIEHF